MAVCSNCGQWILFGGIKHGTMRFCNKKCYDASATFLNLADQLPDDVVEQAVSQIHQGDCPCCGGAGPIDVHYSYRVMSFFVVTQFQTIPKISCVSCAVKPKVGNFLTSFFLGWWGVPFGLLITPVYLYKNLYSLVFPVSTSEPSLYLREYVRNNLAHQAMTHAIAGANVADSDDIPYAALSDNNFQDHDEPKW